MLLVAKLSIFVSLKSKEMSIQVKELTKIYGRQKAIDQISFEIKTGEIVGFVGPEYS